MVNRSLSGGRLRIVFSTVMLLGAHWVAARPTTQAQGAKIEAAWIRWLPAGVPLAGYATVTNLADRPIVLTGASSIAFREVSIHQTVHTAGDVNMVATAQITIAPHSTLDFESRGYHFMLMQSTEPLDSAKEIPIILRFADGSSLTVPFRVRRGAGN
jgi:periplasmic copper chaperone A